MAAMNVYPFRYLFFLLIWVYFPIQSALYGFQSFPLQTIEEKPYILRSWNTLHGLPVNQVFQVTQDNDGYLWMTTYTGLIRFDGLNFTIFNASNTPDIPHNRFQYAYNDQNGNLWFSLEYGGVLRHKNNRFTYYDGSNGFTYGRLNNYIFTNHRGHVVFTTGRGLFYFDGSSFNELIQQNGTPHHFHVSR